MAINPATIRTIEQARRALAALVNGAVQVRQTEYLSLMERVLQQLRRLLESEVDLLADTDDDDPAFQLNFGNIREQERMRRLMRTLQFGMSEWADAAVRTTVSTAVKDIVPLADTVEEDAIASQLPPEQRDFARPALPELIEEVIGRTEDRMAGVLQPFSRQYAKDINQALIDGIALGQNPREAARSLTQSVQQKMNEYGSDALRFMRTEMLDAYRNADLAARTTNQAVLRGWMWYSAGDERTCASCWAMHGTEYSTTVPGPDDHPNGRCVAIPIVRDDLALPDQPPIPSRQELWDRLSPAQQRAVLGPSRSFLFETGRIGWDDMSKLAGGGEHYRAFHVARPVRELEQLAVMREPVVRGGMAGHLEWSVANFPSADSLGELPQQYGMYHQMLAQQYLDLTPEDDAALQHWITAEGFQSINGILRGDPEALKYLRDWAADNGIENLVELEDTKTIALIDLMMRDNPIPAEWLANAGFRNDDGDEGLLVFRAFSDEGMVMRRWQVGDRYTDDGYMAATLDRSFAENWVFEYHGLQELAGNVDIDDDPFGAVYSIEVPAGTHGMFIGGPGQQEFLFARGTTLEVVGFDDANRPIFRAISDTAVLPADDADLYSWIRDAIQPYARPQAWDMEDLLALPDPMRLEALTDRTRELEQSVEVIQRNIHRLEEEAIPVIRTVGRDHDISGQQIYEMIDRMYYDGLFPADVAVTNDAGRVIRYVDQGIGYAVTALDAGDSRGSTITLLDEAFGPGEDAAVAGALNFTEKTLQGEPTLVVEWLGTTGITRGAGAALIGEAVKEAADRGLPVRVTSTETALDFYKRLGFQPEFDLSDNQLILRADEARLLADKLREEGVATTLEGGR